MEVPQLQCSEQGGRCPRCAGRRLGLMEGGLRFQFIARVSGTFQFATETGTLSAGYGGDEWGFSAFLGHFSRSSRSSGVERQFSEPSMMKSSSSSRALLHN